MSQSGIRTRTDSKKYTEMFSIICSETHHREYKYQRLGFDRTKERRLNRTKEGFDRVAFVCHVWADSENTRNRSDDDADCIAGVTRLDGNIASLVELHCPQSKLF
jgi:regulatory protein YycH of two-component signal transduction system YycFG